MAAGRWGVFGDGLGMGRVGVLAVRPRCGARLGGRSSHHLLICKQAETMMAALLTEWPLQRWETGEVGESCRRDREGAGERVREKRKKP